MVEAAKDQRQAAPLTFFSAFKSGFFDSRYVIELGKSGLSLVLYSATSVATVFLNRRLFTRQFKHPLLVTWIQQLMLLAVFELFSLAQIFIKLFFGKTESLLSSHSPSRKTRCAAKVLKLLFLPALSFMGMVVFSNLCLQHAPVSTYQVARSTTIMFNLILSLLLVSEPLSMLSVFACFITGCGFLIGTLDPSTLSWKSCMTGILGSFFQALHSVCLKSAYTHKTAANHAQVLYGIALINSVAFLPFLWFTGELWSGKLLWPFKTDTLAIFGYVMLSSKLQSQRYLVQ